MIEGIKQTIQQALPNSEVVVLNENQDMTHFEAYVISTDFNSMPLLKRHRLIMNSLKARFDSDLHALKVHALTPLEWEQHKTTVGK